MAKYLSAFPSINLFDPVTEIVEEGLSDLDDEDDDDLQMKPMYFHFLVLLTTAGYCYEQTCTPWLQPRSIQWLMPTMSRTQLGSSPL
jgi:hypothetical protein